MEGVVRSSPASWSMEEKTYTGNVSVLIHGSLSCGQGGRPGLPERPSVLCEVVDGGEDLLHRTVDHAAEGAGRVGCWGEEEGRMSVIKGQSRGGRGGGNGLSSAMCVGSCWVEEERRARRGEGEKDEGGG